MKKRLDSPSRSGALPRTAFLALAIALWASCAVSRAEDKVDQTRILDHIHKSFNTPTSYKMRIKDLKPSEVPGMLSGTLEIQAGKRTQNQPLQVTRDGRYYIISPTYKLGPGVLPGTRKPLARPGKPPPPPIHVTPDGRHMLMGEAQDASIDPEKDVLSKIDLKGAPSKGPAKAPILLVEYSELQCPHCARAHKVIEGLIEKDYKGKVRWVFKHYPLENIHPWARDASIAALCAHKLKPRAHFDMAAAFYKAQRSITAKNVKEKGLEFAKKAGLDEGRFRDCLDKEGSKDILKAHIEEADRLGVQGTPALYVNGRQLRDYREHELRRIFDEMLERKKK